MFYKTALITGASSGIGRALAKRLARDGIHVIICARREAELAALADEICAAQGQASVLVLDVADTAQTVSRIRAVDREVGGLDLIVANAGVGLQRGPSPYAWESMADVAQINFTGALATLTAVLPEMIARRRGHLAGVSSLASFGALPRAAAYCAPKAGLSMFLECLRIDLRGYGVKVTAIHPGFVATPMVAEARHPMPQLVSPEQAAEIIATRLPRAPATIDFPQPLAWLTRLGARMPRALRDLIFRVQRFN